MARARRMAECHPDQQHYALGMCKGCYRSKAPAYKRAKADNQRVRHARMKALIQEAKSVPCADCGERYPYYVMDLDHRPESGKILPVSQMKYMSKERILAEIAKCDVVCSNCHRIRSHGRL